MGAIGSFLRTAFDLASGPPKDSEGRQKYQARFHMDQSDYFIANVVSGLIGYASVLYFTRGHVRFGRALFPENRVTDPLVILKSCAWFTVIILIWHAGVWIAYLFCKWMDD